jgi:hypothetical protein
MAPLMGWAEIEIRGTLIEPVTDAIANAIVCGIMKSATKQPQTLLAPKPAIVVRPPPQRMVVADEVITALNIRRDDSETAAGIAERVAREDASQEVAELVGSAAGGAAYGQGGVARVAAVAGAMLSYVVDLIRGRKSGVISHVTAAGKGAAKGIIGAAAADAVNKVKVAGQDGNGGL